jgi:mannose/fructose/N-acetylgalactosamine-specific phosphotransferase system component IIB
MAISSGSAGMNTLGTSIVNPMYTDNNVRQVAIKGESFTVSKSFQLDMINSDVITPDEIKQMLIREIVEQMMDSNFIEFTKLEDVTNYNITFRARVFVVPDSQVRILRLEGVIE